MPRFNFSAYVARNSLTDFSNCRDLDPQGEWETKKKAFETCNKTSSDFAADISKEYSSSTSTSDMEKTLQHEVEILTKELIAAGVEQLLDTTQNPKPVKMEPQLGDSGFHSCLNIDESFFVTEVPGNVTAHARNSASPTSQVDSPNDFDPPRTSTPTSLGDGREAASVPAEQTEPSILSPQKQSFGTSKDSRVTFQEERNITCSEGPSALSGQLIMALDDIGTFQPLRRRVEVDEILRHVGNDDLPLPSKDIMEAVQKLKHIPINQICHFSVLGEYVRHLHENERITDVNIRIGPNCFAAHRVALACFSEYFAELFFKMAGKQKVPIDIRLRGICPEAFETFMQFVYTSNIKINRVIIGDLLVMADNLRIPKLKAVCSQYVEEMPLEQALMTIQDGNLKPENELSQYAWKKINENFSDINKRDIFLQSDFDTLNLILSSGDLLIKSEIEVFRFGLNWLAFSLNERKDLIEKVMECVRFTYMTQEELFECMTVTDLLRTNAVCRGMILKANWVVTARNLNLDDPINYSIARPRHCYANVYKHEDDKFFTADSVQGDAVEVAADSQTGTPRSDGSPKSTPRGEILAVGSFQKEQAGKGNKEVKSVERYQLGDNQWKHCTNLPEPRFHHAAATLSGNMYISGGIDPSMKRGVVATAEAYVLNMKNNEWKQIATMNTPRMHHSLCVLFGLIYAVGGQDDQDRVLRSVECYNPLNDKWFYVKSMSVGRVGAGSSVLEGILYVAGGYGDPAGRKSGRPILSSVECFDPKANTWTMKKDLRFPRCHTSLVTVNGEMFICGGATRLSITTGDSVVTSVSNVDIYNKEIDVWEHKTDTVVPRHSAGITAIDGKIYFVGGRSTVTDSLLQSIECYDVENNTWINGVKDLPYPARWLCCVAVPEKH